MPLNILRIVLFNLFCCINGCAALNAGTAINSSDDDSFIIQGGGFKHRVFINHDKPVQTHRPLIVLIDGDGAAVTRTGKVAKNPTPRDSFLLNSLPKLPPGAIYLGRPCYHDTQDNACHPAFWSIDRYAAEIINSLAAAIQKLNRESRSVVLIGYSGGATLAYGVAQKLPQVVGLITLAGNMNVGLWNQYHGYTPMHSAVDPAMQPPLPCSIQRIHLIGHKDQNIKQDWLLSWVKREQQLCNQVQFIVLDNTGHKRGWKDWNQLINWEKLSIKKRVE